MAAPAPDVRRRVLDAALPCFLDDGLERTTVAAIRARAGVSNGALFHHFASKEAIADALFVEAMASFQEGLWALLGQKPRTLRAAVRGAITHQLTWIEEHPDLARFLYLRGQVSWDAPAGAEVARLNRDLAAALRAWMAPLIESGAARPLSTLLITAIVTAPGHAVAQRWLAGQLEDGATPLRYADDLIDAAVAGLSGTPSRARRAAPVPASSRVVVELLDADGTVLSRGETTTPLS